MQLRRRLDNGGSARRWSVRAIGAGLVALSLIGVIGTAGAQNAQGAAEALFKEAVTLAKKGEFASAVDKFEASYQLDPAPGTLLGLAMAEEKAGRVAAALAHYRDLLAVAKKDRDKPRTTAAEAGIRRVEPKVARIVLSSDKPLPADAEITLDGVSIPVAAIGSELPVDPGERMVRITTRNGEFTAKATLAPGATETIVIKLKSTAPAPSSSQPPPTVTAEAEAPSTGSSGLRTTGLIIGGIGVAAAGAGTWLWLKSGKTFDEVESACPDRHCSPDLQSKVDDGKQQESFGRIALIAGGVLAATGVTLFVLGSTKKESPAPATARWMVGPGSLLVTGSF